MGKFEIISLVLGLLATAFIFVSYYFKVRYKIRNLTEEAINKAENQLAVGKAKLDYAVEQIYSCIPAVFKPFITKAFVANMIQKAFDEIKEFAKKQEKK